MASIKIRGYDINFPYPVPYDIQQVYMDKVLICLDQKTHAVLESPTGTGKTLCLFAPVAAWAKQKKKQVHFITDDKPDEFGSTYFDQNEQSGNWGNKQRPKIWYTARTHSQIAQTIGEVRKCNIEGLNVRVMGARDQLCINNTIIEEKNSYVKTVKCKELVKNKQCRFYNKLAHEKDSQRYYQSDKVLDIEDLVSLGKACGVCPYFLAKKGSETADIVLLPYNYIIDKESRDANGIFLQNDVIIFDEGHNIPSTCEESYEFSFSTLDVALGIRNMKDLMLEISKLPDVLSEDDNINIAMHANNSIFMMTVLQKLESGLEKLPASNKLLPVSALYDFFDNLGVNDTTFKEVLDGIQQFKNDSNKLTLTGSTLETFKLLEKMMNVISGPTVKSFDAKTIESSFKCGVINDPEIVNKVKRFSLYCFNPKFGIKNLLQLGVQSIIITSGTLSPLRTFISELGLPNPVTLENRHIAKKCQVPFVILGTGVNNVRLDGAYKNRNDPKYVSSLGMTLTNLISSIPDGILLLFSSYTMMQNLKEAWESDFGIWTRLNALKRVFVEPRNKEEFINCMENYRRAIDSGNGAILMGVLRGKISEGMDFKDQYCRGVFIIGVPFPPVQDPRVQGKEKYAESLTVINPNTKMEEKLYNNSFMSEEAMRATNQAIGRVIRHGQDYGVIILVDYRFAWPRLFSNISSWLRGNAPFERNFPTTKKLVRDFFKDVHEGKVDVCNAQFDAKSPTVAGISGIKLSGEKKEFFLKALAMFQLGFEEIRRQRVDSNGCPVASYVSYEEYDHKKNASQAVPWIGGAPNSQESKSGWKPRGHSKIEFVDDEVSPQDLVAKYRNAGTNLFANGTSESAGSCSLLDALESSRNSGVGYREFDKNYNQNSESNKRKYEEDEDTRRSSPPSSLSVFSFPDGSQKQKKFPRLKVRPLIPSDPDELKQQNAVCDTPPKSESRTNDDLKVKLIDYYRKVKQTLSEKHDQEFKRISSKYMKGEVALAEVIKSMDEMFLSPGNKNLFTGFGICVKSKDKDEWMNACRERKVHSP